MKNLLTSSLGRLRLLGFCEGATLVGLVLVGMPLKYLWELPFAVRLLGPIHGLFFLLFIAYGFKVSLERDWNFTGIPLKLFIASFIPFGNFYADHFFLKPLQIPRNN